MTPLGLQPLPPPVSSPATDGLATLVSEVASPTTGIVLSIAGPVELASPVAHSVASMELTINAHMGGDASSMSPQVSPGMVGVPAAVTDKVYKPSTATARRSARNAVAEDVSTAMDEDMMLRAMRRKAAKNLDFSGMDSSFSSFIPLSMHVLSSKLNSVSISLGKNSSEINVSANVLRRMEFDRLTVTKE
jgi:hypothetical protein